MDIVLQEFKQNANKLVELNRVRAILIELVNDFHHVLLLENVFTAHQVVELARLDREGLVDEEPLEGTLAVLFERLFAEVDGGEQEIAPVNVSVSVMVHLTNDLIQFLVGPYFLV